MSIKLAGLFVGGLLITACAANATGVVTTEQQATTTSQVERTTSTATPSTTAPTTKTTQPTDPRVDESALVAEDFMRAFAARDLAGIEATAVEGHVFGILVDQFALFEQEFSWRDATGWDMTVNECTVENPDIENVRLACSVIHETAWSRALGVGPYESEFFVGVSYPGTENWVYPELDTPTVTDRTFAQFPAFFFKSESWTPFLTWLEENHPEDLTTMFSDLTFSETGFLPGEPLPALSPESITLWEEHTLEFVETTTG